MKQTILKTELSTDSLQLKHIGTILLVSGKKSYELCGAREKLNAALKEHRVVHFSDFRANPRLEDLKAGLSLLEGEDISQIIAVGGGSVMDMAKLLRATVNTSADPEKIILGEEPLGNHSCPELSAVPTTSGSGSESTHFAVVYIEGTKYSLAHESLLPDKVILDPTLTMSSSPYQTACSGLDALAQAVESYWNVFATAESRDFAARGSA